MAFDRKKILLVDPDFDGMQALKNALMQRGYKVGQVRDAERAQQIVAKEIPDAVISEISLPGKSGGEFYKFLQTKGINKHLVYILVAEQKILDDRIAIIELGADDFIPKPFHPREVLSRLENIFYEREDYGRGHYESTESLSGSLREMSVVDLIEIFTVATKSGVLHLHQNGKEGYIYLSDGQVVDATLSGCDSKEAIGSMLTWEDGSFQVEFKEVDRRKTVTASTDELLTSGLARLNQWAELSHSLPPLDSAIEQNSNVALEVPLSSDEKHALSLLDQPLRIRELIDRMGGDDLSNLKTIKVLFEKKLTVVTNKTVLDNVPAPVQKFEIPNAKSKGKGKTLAQIAVLFEASKSNQCVAGSNLGIKSDIHVSRMKAQNNLTRTELMLIRERLS